jgi:hypothetical protein
LFFKNDGVLFTFENYVGSKKSGLFDFYKSCYALLLGYYPTITLEYFMPNYLFTHFGMQYINDILAPIYNLIDINFSSKVIKIDNQISPTKITMSSNYKTSLLGKSFFEKKSTLTIFENSIIEIENQKTKNKYLIACEAY